MLCEYKLLTFRAEDEREMADVLSDWGSAGWKVLHVYFGSEQSPLWRVMMEREYPVPSPDGPPMVHPEES